MWTLLLLFPEVNRETSGLMRSHANVWLLRMLYVLGFMGLNLSTGLMTLCLNPGFVMLLGRASICYL